MSSASFIKTMRWLLPLLLLVGACIFVQRRIHAEGIPLGFLEDRAWADLGVARNWFAQETFGLAPNQPTAPVAHSLWQALLIVGGAVFGDLVSVALLFNLLLTIGLLLVLLRFAREWFPLWPFLITLGCVAALSPVLVGAAISGMPVALASLLVAGALFFHFAGLRGEVPLLPFRSALLIGLAMLVQLEFVLFWLVFGVHAVGCAAVRRKGVGFAVVQWAAGLLVCGLCLWPAVDAHLKLLQVPWPVALDAGSVQGEGIDLRRGWGLVERAAAGGVGWVLFLLGGVVLVLSSIRRVADRPYLLLLVLPVVIPFGLVLTAQGLGWSGASLVVETLQPLTLLVGVWGLFRLPFVLDVWGVALPRDPRRLMLSLHSVVAVVLFGLVLFQARSFVWRHTKILGLVIDDHTRLQQVLERADLEGKLIATDSGGWLAWRGYAVLDLQGRYSPSMLYCITEQSAMDLDILRQLLSEQQAGALVAWHPRYDSLLEGIREAGGARPLATYRGGPQALMLQP